MQVVNKPPVYQSHWHPIHVYEEGSVVRFRKNFHQDHRTSDLFMILAVPACYEPRDRKRTIGYDTHDSSKVGLANLRTGGLSYIMNAREARAVNVEVHNLGDCC